MSLEVNTNSGIPSVVPTSSAAPQAAVDAAISRIDNIQSAITGICEAIAAIQEAIAILEQERAAQVAPNPGDYYKTEERKTGTPPNEKIETIRVLDKAAYDAVMSKYLATLARLDGEIQAKKTELAAKETELAAKETELSEAEQELEKAQKELEEALEQDAAKLQEAQERYQQEQIRIQQMHEQALQAQAEAQKAQEELDKAQQELDKIKNEAADLAGVDAEQVDTWWEQVAQWDGNAPAPFAVNEEATPEELQDSYNVMKSAEQAIQEDMQAAINCLPRIEDGALQPPLQPLSATDFIEVAPQVASIENGIYTNDSGLLAGFDENASPTITPELAMQMYNAWHAAGFSAEAMQIAMQGLTGVAAFRFDPTTLYGPSGIPAATDVDQDAIGDCYLMATLGALANQQPDAIKDMIKYDPYTGDFIVTMHERKWHWLPPGYKTEEVEIHVTQADLEDNINRRGGSTADNTGNDALIWPAVIETAYAKQHDGNWSDGLDEGYNDINGGWPREALFALTGSKGTDIHSMWFLPEEADAERMYNIIDTALNEDRPVTLTTNPDEANDGLAEFHVYTVERIYKDEAGNIQVVLRNPWNHNLNIGEGLDSADPVITVSLETLLTQGSFNQFNVGNKP
ncbi:MAG: hypothetical protein JW841_14730 [Deltaproteobacteria bacterium]|nr:hypothetical protein [Deltaproteobacteria bacterium]